jgi:valyl-tRNA synthetase
MEISKVYDPKQVEDKWYKIWLEKNYFAATVNKNKKPYVIVIPPPNVTSILHMGHALNNTIQDIFIRFRRKQGYETLWQPGTDHAGIATQNVVEKNLAEQNTSRHDIGREEFVKKVWEWRQKYGSTIIHQLKKLGCSCDWNRERFTMDEGLSNAVKEVFIRLYEKQLIYKGKYIINWCPRCSTALSDEEVEHRETHGHLWYFKYPLKDSDIFITVATTRPETMLGDTAVAVNPNDKRYRSLIGKTAVLPLLNREIRIIADEFVDPEFGTGCVKVTPAHDPNDFLMGQRHQLPEINIMHTDGKLNEAAGPYAGLDRFVARNKVVQDMEKQGLKEKVVPHHNNIGHCHRCHTVVEPYLSEQWFVRVAPLAKPALDVVRQGKIKLHPKERWFKTYENWMENVRDWCISRQLWWGHRIPVYYCRQCSEMMISRETPKQCSNCNSTDIRQDEDVLDTWFSSWLWPFSTLGWPEKNEDVDYFYPTDLLVTGPDIIFFWVARMIMAGLEFRNNIPFKDVLLNGIVRDESGRKMSKSLGNGIDPLEMIEQYSADAVRFTLNMLSSEGQDINLSVQHFEMGRNFSNKIWNAFRFLSMNRDEGLDFTRVPENNAWEIPDRWIVSRLQKTIEEVTANLNKFRVNDALNSLYQFFWHDYCDWYLEFIKSRLYDSPNEQEKNTVLSVALYVLKESMNLLHPYMPFITEEIWQNLKAGEEESIVTADWPVPNRSWIDEPAEEKLQILQTIIGNIRNIRAEMNVPHGKEADIYLRTDDRQFDFIKLHEKNIRSLAKIRAIYSYDIKLSSSINASTIIKNIEVYMPLADLIDIEKEKNRLRKDIDRLEALNNAITKKLSNQNFIDKAPDDVVQKEKDKLANNLDMLEKVRNNYQQLSNK